MIARDLNSRAVERQRDSIPPGWRFFCEALLFFFALCHLRAANHPSAFTFAFAFANALGEPLQGVHGVVPDRSGVGALRQGPWSNFSLMFILLA